MNPDLRYPIGKFIAPELINSDMIQVAISKILTAPERLKIAVQGMSQAQFDTPYRPDGWTVRQVIHHLADSHMNAYIRFHWTLTEDSPKIKAYDERSWAELPYQDKVEIETSLGLLDHLHKRWVVLLNNLENKDWAKIYIHPEGDKVYALNKVVLLYAWHGDHHIAHITCLKERMGW